MIETLNTPISISEVMREVQQDQLTIWLSIHDEIDLTVNNTLLQPIMLEVNKIAELRQVFASINMPYLAFFLDNEYDDYGSFTASKNAHIELYGMNFKGNKTYVPVPKIKYIVDATSMSKSDVKFIASNAEEDENGVQLSLKLPDGVYTSLVKYNEDSLLKTIANTTYEKVGG